MLQLPNNCRCSDITVHPKNWDNSRASLRKEWYVYYRFYDPKFAERYPKGYLKIVKSNLNSIPVLEHRQEAVRVIVEELHMLLVHDGFNPITGVSIPAVSNGSVEIFPHSRLMDAFWYVYERLKVHKRTMDDIKCVIGKMEVASRDLFLSGMTVGTVKRKHIKMILERVEKNSEKFSDDRYNKFRSYLMILFSELVELELIESNPIREMKKRKVIKNERALLTLEERKKVDSHLKNKRGCYTFWRFMHIFFHSGCRESELISMQLKHIDVEKQQFKVLVKKGRNYNWQVRTIKDVVLPMWQEAIKDAGPDDYIFSEGLKPGSKMIRPDQISKRWIRHVKAPISKGGLGIKADFYSLKHSNLDETAAQLDINAAAAAAGHTTPVITLKHYALGEKARNHERIKKVANSFS